MTPFRARALPAVLFAIGLGAATNAAAQQQLNVICSAQGEWCNAIATEFQRETGIKVAITPKGSGESIAQLAAEKANPKLDVWFGGTGDPHLQAAEQGLTEEYKSPLLKDLQPWAQKQAEQSKYRTVGIYLGVLGIGYNTDMSKMAPKAVMTSPVWNWGPYYVKVVESIKNKTWKNDQYWGSMKDNVVDLAPFGPMVTDDSKKLVADAKKKIVDGTWDVFWGPVKDQSGAVKIAAGQKMSDGDMLGFNWFVEGVEGTIPK